MSENRFRCKGNNLLCAEIIGSSLTTLSAYLVVYMQDISRIAYKQYDTGNIYIKSNNEELKAITLKVIC